MVMGRKTDDSLILKFHKEGKSQRWIARQLGCSKTAVLKRLRLTNCDQAGNQKETTKIPKPKYSVSSRYLRKIGTEQIFIWTKYIAVRSDMQEVKWDGRKFVLVYRGDQHPKTNPYD